MKSQMLKMILAIVLTAGIAGGGVYYWQHKEGSEGEVKTVEQKATKEEVKETASADLFELAKTTKEEFTYLISAPKLDGEWRVIVNNNFPSVPMSFSFKYKNTTPWGEMRYVKTDLTASDGASLTDLQGISSYKFCAGQYYCDDSKSEGMGFKLTFWNAKYKGKAADPQFYLKNGDTFFKETENYIITYKPFTASAPTDVTKEVANLMSSFEIY